jgi:hypothetical protein
MKILDYINLCFGFVYFLLLLYNTVLICNFIECPANLSGYK